MRKKILCLMMALAALSCVREPVTIGPDTERTVRLEAALEEGTRAVDLAAEGVSSSWNVGDEVALVKDNERLTTLTVTSVKGRKAQLTGTVKGAYPAGTAMTLYYGYGADLQARYDGQAGTAASAATKAYMKAEVTISAQDNKTLTLSSALLEHQQAYVCFTFREGQTPLAVSRLTVTAGGSIVKTQALGADAVCYGGNEGLFTVDAAAAPQSTFWFALRDVADPLEAYSLTITAGGQTYTATTAGGYAPGNFYTNADIVLVKTDAALEIAPALRMGLIYNTASQNLIIAGEPAEGATIYYAVGDTEPAADAWSQTVPQKTEPGSYKVWYKVTGGKYFKDVAPTVVGENGLVAIAKRTAAITKPAGIGGLKETGSAQELVNPGTVRDALSEDFDPGLPMLYTLTTEDPSVEANRPDFTTDEGWSTDVPRATAEGTYYVWYKVRGGAHYEDVNIPYDGASYPYITVNIGSGKTTPDFTAPTAKDVVYDGTAQPLVNAGVVPDGCTMYYMIAETKPAAGDDGWNTAVPTATEIATYHVWYKIDGGTDYFDVGVCDTPVDVTIGKGVATVNIVNVSKSLPYTGSARTLVTADDYTISNATDEAMVVQYSTGTATEPTSEWSDTAPAATHVADTPVYVWIKALASTHYAEAVSTTCITASVTPVTPEVSITLADGWAYDTEAHPLVASASLSPDFGTLEYNVGASEDAGALDAAAWSSTVPQATGMGTYYVFTRVVGDGSDVNSVDPALAGSVRVGGAVPTLTTPPTVNPDELIYSGSAYALLTAGGETSDGTLSYMAIKSETEPEAPGTNDSGWVDPYTSLTATDAGDYYVYVKITGDATHADKVFGPYGPSGLDSGPKTISKAPATLTCTDTAPLSFTTAQGAGSTQEKTGVSCTGGTVTVSSGTPANCTASFSEGTITVTRVSTEAFENTVITVSVTPDANHYWLSDNNVIFNVSAVKYSSLNGGNFQGFLNNEGNEVKEW